MAFLQAYLITSAWTGPDDTLPAVQCVASPHVCVGVGYVGAEVMVAYACLLMLCRSSDTMMSMLI